MMGFFGVELAAVLNESKTLTSSVYDLMDLKCGRLKSGQQWRSAGAVWLLKASNVRMFMFANVIKEKQ